MAANLEVGCQPHTRDGCLIPQCFVERDRQGMNRLHPVYRLFLSDGKQFLLCAQKRASSKTANYLLTMEKHPSASRRDTLIVGKLRSNWVSLHPMCCGALEP